MKLLLILYFLHQVSCLNLPKIWTQVSLPFKNKARDWFIGRAETLGIEWTDITSYYQKPEIYSQLIANKIDLDNVNLQYPSYYTKPFHGYDSGNLNWLAAQEAVPATLNIAAGYWPNASIEDTQLWLRKNTTQVVNDYYFAYKNSEEYVLYPSKILDIGCSIGISTEYFQKEFPKAKFWGLDLSSYFLAVAKFRSDTKNLNITYVHNNAENINFDNDFFSLITCNFLFHELPLNASMNILKEIYRTLEPNGVISITDIEPEIINKKENNILTPFRRWMFEITEPHIYSYYENNMKDLLLEIGFTNIVKARNDPVNSVWIAQKI